VDQIDDIEKNGVAENPKVLEMRDLLKEVIADAGTQDFEASGA